MHLNCPRRPPLCRPVSSAIWRAPAGGSRAPRAAAHLLMAALLLGALARCVPRADEVALETSERSFGNPERGFYLHRETHSNEYRALEAEALQALRLERGITLVYRGFILDDFADAPISEEYLARVDADFAALRRAGMKAIVRFAYTTQVRTAPGSSWPPLRPYGDAPLPRVLEHLDQLEPLLQRHRAVIAAVQAGFIGLWGEWFYTDHFAGDDLDHPSPEQWEARRQVAQRLLAALPPSHAVQVRTPLHKWMLVGDRTPLSPAGAHTGTLRARLGHHNDCFLASDTDHGTYREPQADRAFLEIDSRYVPVGGETCSPNPPRSQCAGALAELERLHWSYLNSAYHPDVLSSWRDGGCLDEIERRLGHRLYAVGASYARQARPGVPWRLQVELANQGFAAPYLPRRVHVVLRHRGSGREFRADLGLDLRQVGQDGSRRLDCPLNLDRDMPPGEYAVLLHLPDPDPGLAARPEYAIQLANRDVWEPATGYNRLPASIRVLEPAWLSSRVEVSLRESPPATRLGVPVEGRYIDGSGDAEGSP